MAHFADLVRIPGVGLHYAQLLLDVGVENLDDLAHRRAETLACQLRGAAVDRDSTQAPSEQTVDKWIGDALTLLSGTAAAW